MTPREFISKLGLPAGWNLDGVVMFKERPGRAQGHFDQAVEVRVRDPKGKRFVISVREE